MSKLLKVISGVNSSFTQNVVLIEVASRSQCIWVPRPIRKYDKISYTPKDNNQPFKVEVKTRGLINQNDDS